jgi:hypothetical protein
MARMADTGMALRNRDRFMGLRLTLLDKSRVGRGVETAGPIFFPNGDGSVLTRSELFLLARDRGRRSV